MGLTFSSFYGLARVNNSGPEVKNWAATDSNVQTTSLLLKSQELHIHNGATPMRYPGYNPLLPATPSTPVLTLSSTGGSIAAGVTIGVRTSFTNNIGLETEASPEVTVLTPAIVTRPAALISTGAVTTPVPGAVSGGTYIYAITKRLGTGETETSDVLTVTVPYDATGLTSYTVPLSFSSINSYTDGTDSLCIYRSTGFDSSFVLLNIITATPGRQNALATYVDNNTIQNSQQQPPQSSQFAKQNAVTIDWSRINMPASAVYFNVYVTQQASVYGVNSQLQSYLLTNPATPLPPNYTYQGTEVLAPGYPQEFSQIPQGAAPIYLTTQAYGGPRYTEPADAQGWPTYNFVFPTQAHATPIMGNAYLDSSSNQFKVALSNTGVYTTLAAVGSGYAHPIAETGGHAASKIQVAANVGGPTQDQLNNLFSTPVAGGVGRWRIGASSVYKVTATPSLLQNSVAGVYSIIPDMDTVFQWPNGISPDFTGQWFEINFSGTAQINAAGKGNVVNTAARAYRSSAFTPSGSLWTKVPLNAKNVDLGNNFDAVTNNRYNVPLTGWYQVNGATNYTTSSAFFVGVAIYQNGSVVSQNYVQQGAPTAGGGGVSVSDLVYCNAGDYLELWTYVNPSLAMNFASITNFMSVVMVDNSIGASVQYGTFNLLINGVTIWETNIAEGGNDFQPGGSRYMNPTFYYATPLTRSNNRFQVQWQPSFAGSLILPGSNVPGGFAEHSFVIREIF